MTVIDKLSGKKTSILDELIREDEKESKENELPPSAYAVEGLTRADLQKPNRHEGIVGIRKGKRFLFDANGSIPTEALISNKTVTLLAVLEGDKLERAIKEGVSIRGKSERMFSFVEEVKKKKRKTKKGKGK